jgi:hypothetical protein
MLSREGLPSTDPYHDLKRGLPQKGSPPPVASRGMKAPTLHRSDQLTVDALSWLQGALHTRVDSIE